MLPENDAYCLSSPWLVRIKFVVVNIVHAASGNVIGRFLQRVPSRIDVNIVHDVLGICLHEYVALLPEEWPCSKRAQVEHLEADKIICIACEGNGTPLHGLPLSRYMVRDCAIRLPVLPKARPPCWTCFRDGVSAAVVLRLWIRKYRRKYWVCSNCIISRRVFPDNKCFLCGDTTKCLPWFWERSCLHCLQTSDLSHTRICHFCELRGFRIARANSAWSPVCFVCFPGLNQAGGQANTLRRSVLNNTN